MNILSNLPFFSSSKTDDAARAATELEEKRERIQFHRDHVRNGPVKMAGPTSGQLRRQRQRDLRRQTRRARRAQIANFFETQRLAASVRGHLQAAGVLPYVLAETPIDPHKQAVSAAWLVQRFGKELEDGTVSFAHDDVLVALGDALQFYGEAVGLPDLQVPADYVVPVYEAS